MGNIQRHLRTGSRSSGPALPPTSSFTLTGVPDILWPKGWSEAPGDPPTYFSVPSKTSLPPSLLKAGGWGLQRWAYPPWHNINLRHPLLLFAHPSLWCSPNLQVLCPPGKGHLVPRTWSPSWLKDCVPSNRRRRPQGRADRALQNMVPIHPSIHAFTHVIWSYQEPTTYLETDMVLALMDLGVKDWLHQ